ncbi:hypothetical protein DFH07DRAFT_732692 [Mycena maculata]|uniref:Uncharacterized protein n=1 Tax=Mycena maculata TaxID=230809 RepID=A0AAD7NTD5_9AGAR|nr:hypothetical protein DFH07DRAFT_732692 [Mycena maculata]
MPTPAHTPAPACLPKALAWFVEAHAQITREDLGPHYNAVVAAWIRVDAASRYEQGPTNLPNKSRPTQVTAWIGSARGKRACDTSVPNPTAYAAKWQKWWDSLQPAWRERAEDGTWAVTGGYGANGKEWGLLYQWGVNGTLSIVASLLFWGCAVREDDEARSMWEAAVLDVGWMLEGLAIFYEMFSRRF